MRAGCASGSVSVDGGPVAFSTKPSESSVLDRALVKHLQRSGVRHCVIGGVALAAHGYARYTADVDLLTMDARVLHGDFWRGAAREVEIHIGDADDPLAGLVRWRADPPHDLIVGRGYAMSTALDSAVLDATLEVPIASALGLVLLKLEAGGPQDRNDILALAAAGEALDSFDWRESIEKHLPHLSESARAEWQRVASDLPPARR
jgi:hypothetical protein